MKYTPMVKKAVEIAFKAHDGQVDKGGYPYIMHPLHLAEQMDDEDSCIVAILHDVVEDSPLTLDDLLKSGFTKTQVDAIGALTHDKDMEYEEYITNQVLPNKIARKVKLRDLHHNLNLTRLEKVTEKDIERWDLKYSRSFNTIRSFENEDFG